MQKYNKGVIWIEFEMWVKVEIILKCGLKFEIEV